MLLSGVKKTIEAEGGDRLYIGTNKDSHAFLKR